MVTVCTDGISSMTKKNKGMTIKKLANHNDFILIHCILHQQKLQIATRR